MSVPLPRVLAVPGAVNAAPRPYLPGSLVHPATGCSSSLEGECVGLGRELDNQPDAEQAQPEGHDALGEPRVDAEQDSGYEDDDEGDCVHGGSLVDMGRNYDGSGGENPEDAEDNSTGVGGHG